MCVKICLLILTKQCFDCDCCMLLTGPVIWIIGSSYIRRGEERARETIGANLGLVAKVYWFGWGGLRWHGLLPFFYRSLRGRAAPDVLLIHCGGNDLGCRKSIDLVAAMKQDLQHLYRRFPQMTIVLSDITQRRRWRSGLPGKIDKSRKWVNSVMATFVLGMQGGIVHHPQIVFNKPQLFLRDEVHLSPRGNDIFLK